jgi:SAM-dependent methyltransferase
MRFGFHMGKLYLNIACGNSFVEDDSWLNLDFAPASPAVKPANLLGRLPCPDNSLKLVYSSHFLEHIPYSGVNKFLSECYRVLAKGGVIRLVVPDLENICREYLRCRDLGEHEKANFCIIELLDQCVRTKVGGRLGEYLNMLKQNPTEYAPMIEYVKNRTGDDVLNSPSIMSLPPRPMLDKVKHKISQKLLSTRIHLLTSLLPSAFRQQNVSFASVGEKHAWMWDFYTLSEKLAEVRFRDIQKVGFDSSRTAEFPLIPLDMNPDGTPRKGHSSLYVEAVK